MIIIIDDDDWLTDGEGEKRGGRVKGSVGIHIFFWVQTKIEGM